MVQIDFSVSCTHLIRLCKVQGQWFKGQSNALEVKTGVHRCCQQKEKDINQSKSSECYTLVPNQSLCQGSKICSITSDPGQPMFYGVLFLLAVPIDLHLYIRYTALKVFMARLDICFLVFTVILPSFSKR